MSNYSTGEMAKLCNVSVRTVQFYDQKGILHPSSESEGGRRIYNDNDLTKLRLICTLKLMGLSLDSIKNIMTNELSENILTLLLNEQLKTISNEIAERQKQIKMITILKESISGKAGVPVNAIIDIEHMMMMEKENKWKNKTRNKKKLTFIFIGIGIASLLGFSFMVWLIASRIWWGLLLYIAATVFSLLLSFFVQKDSEFICPKCNSVFKPSLQRAFFTVGTNKVRWMICPNCGSENWCVLQRPNLITEVKNNG